MSTAHVREREQLPAPKVEEVSDGIYAYLQPDGTWGLNNAGFLVGRDGVLVVDTCFTRPRAEAFVEAVKGVTGAPLRTLANTHHHGDHTYGNAVLSTGATIVGHELCRTEMLKTGLSTTALFPGVEWGEITIAPPFVTFADRCNLYVDDLRVEAHHVGPAHTTNDVVYWVPERRVLFAGDLVFNGGTPFVLMGSIAGSLRAYDRLRQLEVDVIVPGHGPPCGPSVYDDMARYLRFVQQVARAGFEGGRTPLETASDTDLGEFEGWLDPERLAGNLHRAYSELRGEPEGTALGIEAIAADMIVYNGGEPLRCLA